MINEENNICNTHCKCQDHTSKNTFKIAILDISFNLQILHVFHMGGWLPAPLYSNIDGLSYPRGRGYDRTFLHNDRKGRDNDYLNP